MVASSSPVPILPISASSVGSLPSGMGRHPAASGSAPSATGTELSRAAAEKLNLISPNSHCASACLPVSKAFSTLLQIANVGYNPLVDNHHRLHTKHTMPRQRQVQPRSGPEKAFGSVLRQIRKDKGFSQMDVDIEFNIDRTYLSAIERGVQSPTLRMIVRLSDALRVPPSEMMRRMEKSPFYRR